MGESLRARYAKVNLFLRCTFPPLLRSQFQCVQTKAHAARKLQMFLSNTAIIIKEAGYLVYT